MKKLILSILFIVCLSSQASALGPMMLLIGGSCIPDCTGTTLCQNFEGTGYDNSESWTPTETASGTVDEDALSSTVGSPSGWCANALATVTTSSSDVASIENSGGDLGDIPISYWRIEFVLVSHSLANTERNSIIEVYNNAWTALFRIFINNDNGDLEILMLSYYDGSGHELKSIAHLSTGVKYRVEVKWDTTNDLWAWRLDGVDQPNNTDGTDPVESEGALTTNNGADEVEVGQLTTGNAAVIYIDRFALSTTGWIGDQ